MTPEDEMYHRVRFARLDERARVRARRFGGRAQMVDLWSVYETAGWWCCFCSDPIDPALRWMQPPVWVPPVDQQRTPAERKLWRDARRQYTQDRGRVVANNGRVASVDHVTPLWRGGDHVEANCRPAHYGCNALDAGGWPGEPGGTARVGLQRGNPARADFPNFKPREASGGQVRFGAASV